MLPISHAIQPLRWIFWGLMLCVFDFAFSTTQEVNGVVSGFRFDVLNDLLGMIIVTCGVSKLRKFELPGSYQSFMLFVFVVSVLNCLVALKEHFIFPEPTPLSLLSDGISIATLLAVVLFCLCMQQLSQTYGLVRSVQSWRMTMQLALFLLVLPLGIMRVVGLLAIFLGPNFGIALGVLAIPILLAMLVPFIHFFISTSRMKREAEMVTAQSIDLPDPSVDDTSVSF
ncbi:hypothetical protein [Aeoliella mucimassa]|uniref:Uncharacterized protein n=1 Tax=Aeoliella mucimassa TaxID=2527972 RepID=A0A518AHN4_9BACT|nr:hypothetical protein [Aeoliella mucimassa]QDU54237.1 hypothetical protein Pan181_04170 [Aeoliella mucimassa]